MKTKVPKLQICYDKNRWDKVIKTKVPKCTEDYKEICINAFNSMGVDEKLNVKRVIDKTLLENEDENDLTTSKMLFLSLAKHCLDNGNYKALKYFAKAEVDNQKLLIHAIYTMNTGGLETMLKFGANPMNVTLDGYNPKYKKNPSCNDNSLVLSYDAVSYVCEQGSRVLSSDKVSKMALLLLDFGLTEPNRTPGGSFDREGNELYPSERVSLERDLKLEDYLPFSLKDYKEARKLSGDNLTTMEHIEAAKDQIAIDQNNKFERFSSSFKI